MNVKEIVAAIHTAKPEITSVYFVGCGASQSDLYPGQYFLTANAKKLRTSLHTANEFLYSTPAAVGPDSIVVTCSCLLYTSCRGRRALCRSWRRGCRRAGAAGTCRHGRRQGAG